MNIKSNGADDIKLLTTMEISNNSFEITKSEATKKVNLAFAKGNENFYDVNIELADGSFRIATPDNLEEGVRFWFIK